jgi:hypothetical protein
MVAAEVADAEAMRELGRRIAKLLRASDLVVLSGELGAGKTTLTQGLGAGLGVRAPRRRRAVPRRGGAGFRHRGQLGEAVQIPSRSSQ